MCNTEMLNEATKQMEAIIGRTGRMHNAPGSLLWILHVLHKVHLSQCFVLRNMHTPPTLLPWFKSPQTLNLLFQP